MNARLVTDVEQHTLFRRCAETHGLRLHRIHMLSATRAGSFDTTQVFDCTCGQRWLLRVRQAEAVSIAPSVLNAIRQTREGQATAPPGAPGAAVAAL